MTTPEDNTAVAQQAGGPDPDEVRSQVRELLGRLDEPQDSTEPAASASEHDLQEQARVLEQAHDVLVRALESAEQG